MKASALREMTAAELTKKLEDAERELWGLRVKVSTQRNTAKIRELRRDVARLKMVLAERAAAGRGA
ncbi:MAG: 50S ribosomal protein L29 [Candidatus Rokubacteria bacterium]|jgi:large subunit ribosomal protein L29|nr:50S ribosomal protein L29 [Candidatus Rokubacteria bacterium]